MSTTPKTGVVPPRPFTSLFSLRPIVTPFVGLVISAHPASSTRILSRVLSLSGFEGGGNVAERLRATLAERRALLERVAQHRLEGDDGAFVDALISELIDQAELGQEWLTIELPEEEEASGRKTIRAVGAEGSTSDNPQR